MRRRDAIAALVGMTLGPRALLADSAAPADPSVSQLGFLSPLRLKTLRGRIARRVPPTWAAWLDLQQRAENLLDRRPQVPAHWHVPGYYRDAEGHTRAKQGLQEDANAAYELALCWQMTGAERYAQTACRLLLGWVEGLKSTSRADDSTLSFSYHFPPLIFAADLLANWPGFSAAMREKSRRFFRETALPMNTMDRANNWGNWGLVLVLACARYLEDAALLDRGERRWKELLERQVDERGHLPHEVHREGGRRGIWYSHFSLFPQTIAAELLRLAGRDVYEWRSPSGRTLRQAFEPLAHWTRYPERFPYWKGEASELLGVRYFSYFEVLHAHWPSDDAAALLAEARPMTARHGAPVLTFTHGDLLADRSAALDSR